MSAEDGETARGYKEAGKEIRNYIVPFCSQSNLVADEIDMLFYREAS